MGWKNVKVSVSTTLGVQAQQDIPVPIQRSEVPNALHYKATADEEGYNEIPIDESDPGAIWVKIPHLSEKEVTDIYLWPAQTPGLSGVWDDYEAITCG